MRINRQFLVVAIIVAALLGLVLFVSVKSGQSHHKAMVQALRHGMESAYDQALLEAPHSPVSTEALRRILLKTDGQVALLPSFVGPEDVFLSVISIPSDDLLCVVRMEDREVYGITGKREWRAINQNQLHNWRHQPLSTNRPIP